MGCHSCHVAGPTKRCGGCRLVRYCSKECQRRDWRAGHHSVCVRRSQDPEPTEASGAEPEPSAPKVCHQCKATDTALRLCGACQMVWYCSVECQQQDWDGGHREGCGLGGMGTATDVAASLLSSLKQQLAARRAREGDTKSVQAEAARLERFGGYQNIVATNGSLPTPREVLMARKYQRSGDTVTTRAEIRELAAQLPTLINLSDYDPTRFGD